MMRLRSLRPLGTVPLALSLVSFTRDSNLTATEPRETNRGEKLVGIFRTGVKVIPRWINRPARLVGKEHEPE